MMRTGIALAVLAAACGKGGEKAKATSGSPSDKPAPAAPFTSIDDEAAAMGVFMDEVSAAVTSAGGDCTKLDAGFEPLVAKADALAVRIAKLDAPIAKQNALGTGLKAKIDTWAPQIKDCMAKAHVMGFFQSAGWVTVRHQAMLWFNEVAPPTNTVVDAARCQLAVKHSIDVDRKGVGALLSRDEPGLVEMDKILAGHCTNDKWDAVVVTCFETAKQNTDIVTCLTKLPDDQRKLVDDDFAARKAAQPKPDYGFTVGTFEINPTIVHKPDVPSAFGKVPVTMYFGMPTDGLIGNTLKVHVYDVPVKLAAKPDDVFKAERAELLQQKLKLDKDEAVTLGKDTGRDLYFTSTAEDPEFGFAVIRMRWFVHGGKLWMVEGSTMTKAKERAAMEKQNDRWVESFAFTDKAPAKPVPAKKPVTKKKKR